LSLEDKYKLKDFFEGKKVSEHNQKIMLNYLKSIERDGWSKSTVKNNLDIMKFLVSHIHTDLDKLTEDVIDDYCDAVNDWCRQNGKPVSDVTKKQYKVGLSRFLRKYGEKTRNKDLIELSKFNMGRASLKSKLPEDILSVDEIDKMIEAAGSIRDKALVSLMYESGARRGEIEKCRKKDVKYHPHGFHIMLNGKTGARQVLLIRCQTFLREWLNYHPLGDDPNASLFVTLKKYSKKSQKNVASGELSSDKRPDNVALGGPSIDKIIHQAAKAAGIKKRVYPHLLRHSRATHLANTLSEQQLKVRFGWTAGSGMTAVYIHLSGKDVDDAILASYGIIEKKNEEGNKIKVCARCGEKVSPGIRYCNKCGLPLEDDTDQNNDEAMKEMTAIIKKYPELFAKILAKAEVC
jgi:integrase/recombinase XerD